MTNEQLTAEKRKPSGSLRSDEPIRSPDDDLLSRGRLVEVIAGHIRATDAPESVVIALNAPWGAGKSSFLNLLEGRLTPAGSADKQASEQAIIIRFNPWHYGSVEQIVRMFFADLARGIGKAGRQDLGKHIGDLLNTAGANESGELWRLENLAYVLFWWLEWTAEEEIHSAVANHVTEDDKLVDFVGRFVTESYSHTMGDKVSRVHRKINKNNLGALLDLDAAMTRLKEISSGSGDNATAAADFVSLIEASREEDY